MSFLLHQLEQLGMVAIIMACSLLGTAGIIKLIKKVFPFGNFQHPSFDAEKRNKKQEDMEVRK